MTQFQQITAARREIRREEKRSHERAIAACIRAASFEAEIYKATANARAQLDLDRWTRQFGGQPETIN